MRAEKLKTSVTVVVSAACVAVALSGCIGIGIGDPRGSNEPQPGDYPPVTKKAQGGSSEAFSKAEEVTVFNNSNDGVVNGGSTKAVAFTLQKATTISYIQTYHWDSGRPPGQISLKGPDGTVYGPWTAVGTVGQGGMPNAYWEVKPDQRLEAGTYTVVDSDPGSWSTNQQMGMAGQTVVRGYPEE